MGKIAKAVRTVTSAIGLTPETPKLPQLPPPPTSSDGEVEEERRRQRAAARRRRGLGGASILTGDGLGGVADQPQLTGRLG